MKEKNVYLNQLNIGDIVSSSVSNAVYYINNVQQVGLMRTIFWFALTSKRNKRNDSVSWHVNFSYYRFLSKAKHFKVKKV